MPVIGDPVPVAPQPGRRPTNVYSPLTSKIFDVPVPERLKSIRVQTGMEPTIRWTMTEPDGKAIDLTVYLNEPSILSSAAEESDAPGATTAPAQLKILETTRGRFAEVYAAQSPDPASGILEATLDLVKFDAPGIYNAQFIVLGPTGAVVLANDFYLIIEAGLFLDRPPSGPPRIAEIRMALRSSSPVENRLLDNVPFDDAEIAQATAFCVDYFNEAIPRIATRFSTTNFFSRYHWCRGASAQIFGMLAEWYRQNQLQYGAGGIAVDDFNKAPMYEQAFTAYWTEYTTWVRQKKAQMSQDECWGSADSPYSYNDGWVGSWNQY